VTARERTCGGLPDRHQQGMGLQSSSVRRPSTPHVGAVGASSSCLCQGGARFSPRSLFQHILRRETLRNKVFASPSCGHCEERMKIRGRSATGAPSLVCRVRFVVCSSPASLLRSDFEPRGFFPDLPSFLLRKMRRVLLVGFRGEDHSRGAIFPPR
jgi:hypothetical protein